jgi:hypothetical protein
MSPGPVLGKSHRNFPGDEGRLPLKADNLTASVNQLHRICVSLDVSQPHGPPQLLRMTTLPLFKAILIAEEWIFGPLINEFKKT